MQRFKSFLFKVFSNWLSRRKFIELLAFSHSRRKDKLGIFKGLESLNSVGKLRLNLNGAFNKERDDLRYMPLEKASFCDNPSVSKYFEEADISFAICWARPHDEN